MPEEFNMVIDFVLVILVLHKKKKENLTFEGTSKLNFTQFQDIKIM